MTSERPPATRRAVRGHIRLRCADDRGVVVHVRGGLASALHWSLRRKLFKQPEGATAADNLADGWPMILLPLLGLLMTMALGLFIQPEWGVLNSPPTIFVVLVGLAIASFVFGPVLLLPWTMRRQVVRWSIIRLPEGLCLGCSHNLSGCDPQDDGCTVCSECGAAWKLPAAAAPGASLLPV